VRGSFVVGPCFGGHSGGSVIVCMASGISPISGGA
jgi:hypothetical protein